MTARKKAAKVVIERTCKEVTALIVDYLNDALNPSLKRDFKRHLRICPDCVNFLNTYKKTTAITRTIGPEKIPPKIRENILGFLRQRMRKSPVSS
jgi:hypothetical protein